MFLIVPGMVDTIFADVAQPDQTRIVAINAHNFLKNGGHFLISIKVFRKQTIHHLNCYFNTIIIKKTLSHFSGKLQGQQRCSMVSLHNYVYL